MVSSISRNWVAGLSSGMDTQGLIDKIMSMEREPVNRLTQKRDTISFQKTLLQEVNLKLFETQTKATDLIFARTFSSKKATPIDTALLSATATTNAKVGSYTIRVKQLATATKAYSTNGLASPIELGENSKSTNTIGGKNLTLGGAANALGVVHGDLQISGVAGGPYNLDLSAITDTSTVSETITAINSQITAQPALAGKLKATYDEKTDQIKFNLLDSSQSITITDQGVGTILTVLFGNSSIQVNQNSPVSRSTEGKIRSGTDTTLTDLDITTGSLSIQRGAGPIKTLSMAGMGGNTTIAEVIESFNHQLDTQFGWSGNPADRQVEFRFDSSSRKLILANKDPSVGTDITLSDPAIPPGDFTSKIFGAASKTTTPDTGNTISNENFASSITAGQFTINGSTVQINPATDSLDNIISRINSSTDVNATYDPGKNIFSLTRKDGSNSAIGLGAVNDTSNFLTAIGLLNGSQASSATKQSVANLGAIDPNDQLQNLLLVPPVGAAGQLRLTINGQVKTVDYLQTETLNTVLDRIKNTDGIDQAFFDSTTGKVTITTDSKGSASSLKIEDSSGNLASSLKLDPTITTAGLEIGNTLTGGSPVAGINKSVTLDNAGFLNSITAGSFSINGVNFTIPNPNAITLDAVIQAINNNSKVGVNAAFDATSGQIVLTSRTNGNTSISLGGATDTSNFLSATGLIQGNQAIGSNALFSVDGINNGADFIKQTNEISDAITGVTLSLKGLTGANGTSLNIESDVTTARKAIDDFIKSYNETMTLVFTKLSEKHDFTLEALTEEQKKALTKEEVTNYEATFKVGLLSGDSTLQSVRGRMRVIMSSVVSGMDKTLRSLNDIGITTGTVGSSYQDTQQGLLQITNEDKLTTALRDNPDKVADLFAKDGTTDSVKGIGRRLKESLNEFTKSGGLLTRRAGRSGISISNSEMDNQIKLINDQITSQQTRLNQREEALLKQFTDLESAMSKYQSQSSAFSQQLAKLSGSSG